METNYPPADQPRACLHCVWWLKRNSVCGQCRRMPPARTETGEGFWPMTGSLAEWLAQPAGGPQAAR